IPPRTVTLTDALSQTKTPLLYLPDTPEQQLGTIEAGAPEGSKWSPFYSSETPFESALQRGMALRFTYDQSATPMLLYEGRADQLEFCPRHATLASCQPNYSPTWPCAPPSPKRSRSSPTASRRACILMCAQASWCGRPCVASVSRASS